MIIWLEQDVVVVIIIIEPLDWNRTCLSVFDEVNILSLWKLYYLKLYVLFKTDIKLIQDTNKITNLIKCKKINTFNSIC